MNDLSEAYSMYPSADKILEMLNSNKNKSIKRAHIKKTPYWNMVIRLLIASEFIVLKGAEKYEKIILTEKGLNHLEAGGFGQAFDQQPKKEKNKTFKQHLDDLTGLLTIFGILNAVILFASQVRHPNAQDPMDLNLTGVEFISISMYLLSLVVLWEIIWTTLKVTQDTFKFKAFYFLLCGTTIGISLLFLTQYKQFIYHIIFIAIFFAISSAISWLFLKSLLLFINRKNASWFKKKSDAISFLLFIISLIVTAIILTQALPLIFKK